LTKLLDTKDCKDVATFDWCCSCPDACDAPPHIESKNAISIPKERGANQKYISKEPIIAQSLPYTRPGRKFFPPRCLFDLGKEIVYIIFILLFLDSPSTSFLVTADLSLLLACAMPPWSAHPNVNKLQDATHPAPFENVIRLRIYQPVMQSLCWLVFLSHAVGGADMEPLQLCQCSC
jgi:hypothetical protein